MLGETAATGDRENVLTRHVDAFRRPTGYGLSVDGVSRGGIGYAYDAENRICGIAATNAAGRSFAVAYTNVAGYDYGYVITLPNGGTIRRVVARDPFRLGLVTNCSTYHGDTLVDSHAYAYDAGGRPVSRNADAFGYNDRDEVTFAVLGTNVFTHAYDGIGNHVLSGVNAVTNRMENNELNQLMRIVSADGMTTNAISWNANGDKLRTGPLTVLGILEYEVCICQERKSTFVKQDPIRSQDEVLDGCDQMEIQKVRKQVLNYMVNIMFSKIRGMR